MSTYQIPNVNNRPPQLSDLGFYADIRYDANDSAPTYIGMNVTNDESTASTNWKILKFSYSGANVTRIQLSYGSWDNRANLF
jgi:hypothetical protein